MAGVTPRRSLRIPHQHTPKMSERKKGLFQSGMEASRSHQFLTKHRELTVVDSESESDDCDLGIMGALDSSSCDEDHSVPRTPVKSVWRVATRSQTNRLIKEDNDLKNFIRSPFTLKKYQTRYSCPDKCDGSLSTPATPHVQRPPKTPSSTHSCTSGHTISSTSSRARKSLATLIADTESCSSSLKDLNFDTDSASDSKENSPTVRRSRRRQNLTPKLSFKGILVEQKKNVTPKMNPVICLSPMDMMDKMISPTQMLKTPHNTTDNDDKSLPPKLSHRRNVLVEESPESACEGEKSNKRLHYDSKTDIGPSSKHSRLETSSTGSKARLSLFNCDRLKEMLSTKSFYGKTNPDLTANVTAKISLAIETTSSHRRRLFPQSMKRKRRPGQINMGVRHRIRKPKLLRNKGVSLKQAMTADGNVSQLTASSGPNDTILSDNNVSMVSQETQEIGDDKADPFGSEKQTIEALLSQWTEEEVPETELRSYKPRPELPCFSSSVIAETDQIFQPVTVVPVATHNMLGPKVEDDAVFMELGAQKVQPAHNTSASNASQSGAVQITKLGENVSQMAQQVTQLARNLSEMAQSVSQLTQPQDVLMEDSAHVDCHTALPVNTGEFLPVDGGYILVEDSENLPTTQDIPDLDAIDRELRELDEQILRMTQSSNILVSADSQAADPPSSAESTATDDKAKVFPIFSKPNPGITTPKVLEKKEKALVPRRSHIANQYVIDAGQKKFGATQCKECSVIYQIGDPQDEYDHLMHHNAADVLKFNGLKEEYVVGRAGGARCLRVRGGAAGWGRVERLLRRVVHPQLGFEGDLPAKHVHVYTAYLYVDKRQIVGCLVAEPKLKAHRLIQGDPDCCSVETYPVKCGISRIWTHMSYRRRGMASRLLDCARASFLHEAALTLADIAFSAPTEHGKRLASAYTGKDDFYVYLD